MRRSWEGRRRKILGEWRSDERLKLRHGDSQIGSLMLGEAEKER